MCMDVFLFLCQSFSARVSFMSFQMLVAPQRVHYSSSCGGDIDSHLKIPWCQSMASSANPFSSDWWARTVPFYLLAVRQTAYWSLCTNVEEAALERQFAVCLHLKLCCFVCIWCLCHLCVFVLHFPACLPSICVLIQQLCIALPVGRSSLRSDVANVQ